MKRVKLFLTAVTVFAIVGGALAFNAKKGTTVFCGNQDENAGSDLCPAQPDLTYKTGTPAAFYCTSVINTPCTIAATQLISKP